MVRRLSLGLLSVILASCADGKTPDANSFDASAHPFVGCWENESGLQREGWTIDPSGWLIGYAASRDGKGNVTFFEHMRVERGEEAEVLVVTGQDNSETRFTRRAVNDTSEFRFENPSHDYPQAIVYTRKGDALDAYIDLMEGGKKINFNKTRCKGD